MGSSPPTKPAMPQRVGSQVGAQAAQRGCAVTIPGALQGRLAKSLERTALTPQLTLLGAGGCATGPWGPFSPELPCSLSDLRHGNVAWRDSPAHRHHPSPEGCPQTTQGIWDLAKLGQRWLPMGHGCRWQRSATTHLDVPWPVTKKSGDGGGQCGNRLTPNHGQPVFCPYPCLSPCPSALAPLTIQRPAAPQSSPAEMVSARHWSLCVTAGMTAPMVLTS